MPADRCPAPACGATDGEHRCIAAPVPDDLPSDLHRLHLCSCGHRWTEEDDREQ